MKEKKGGGAGDFDELRDHWFWESFGTKSRICFLCNGYDVYIMYVGFMTKITQIT